MKTLTATVNKLSATVSKIFWVVFTLWVVNFILKIEILALVTNWLVPILLVAKPALSYLSKKSKENDPEAIVLADAEGDLMPEHPRSVQSGPVLPGPSPEKAEPGCLENAG